MRQITVAVWSIISVREAMKMKTVVYADVLVVINIIVNYFLLRASAAVISFDFKAWRFLASSALGGAFSLIIFVDSVPAAALTAVKIIFLPLMVLTAFGYGSLRRFFKCCAAFFAANAAFAGLMLAGCAFLFPDSVIYKNSVVYFDINILTLTVAAVVCYAVLSVIARAVRSYTPPQSVCSIRLTKEGRSVEGRALFDTGNSLCDSFSGRPVVIAERKFIEGLLPPGNCGGELDITALHGFRLIPYTTVGGAGALPAFPADCIEIFGGEGRRVENIYIAVTEKRIVHGGYSALIGAALFD